MAGWTMKLQHPHVAVRVKHIRNRKDFVLDPAEDEPVMVLASGTEVVALDLDERVLTPDGDEIQPTGRYYRTTSTIDPYHAVLDVVSGYAF